MEFGQEFEVLDYNEATGESIPAGGGESFLETLTSPSFLQFTDQELQALLSQAPPNALELPASPVAQKLPEELRDKVRNVLRVFRKIVEEETSAVFVRDDGVTREPSARAIMTKLIETNELLESSKKQLEDAEVRIKKIKDEIEETKADVNGLIDPETKFREAALEEARFIDSVDLRGYVFPHGTEELFAKLKQSIIFREDPSILAAHMRTVKLRVETQYYKASARRTEALQILATRLMNETTLKDTVTARLHRYTKEKLSLEQTLEAHRTNYFQVASEQVARERAYYEGALAEIDRVLRAYGSPPKQSVPVPVPVPVQHVPKRKASKSPEEVKQPVKRQPKKQTSRERISRYDVPKPTDEQIARNKRLKAEGKWPTYEEFLLQALLTYGGRMTLEQLWTFMRTYYPGWTLEVVGKTPWKSLLSKRDIVFSPDTRGEGDGFKTIDVRLLKRIVNREDKKHQKYYDHLIQSGFTLQQLQTVLKSVESSSPAPEVVNLD